MQYQPLSYQFGQHLYSSPSFDGTAFPNARQYPPQGPQNCREVSQASSLHPFRPASSLRSPPSDGKHLPQHPSSLSPGHVNPPLPAHHSQHRHPGNDHHPTEQRQVSMMRNTHRAESPQQSPPQGMRDLYRFHSQRAFSSSSKTERQTSTPVIARSAQTRDERWRGERELARQREREREVKKQEAQGRAFGEENRSEATVSSQPDGRSLEQAQGLREQRQIQARPPGFGLGLSQDIFPGPISIASIDREGLVARHLRATGQTLSPGDTILAIDGQTLDRLTLKHFKAMLTAPGVAHGDNVSLIIRSQRSGRIHAVDFPRLAAPSASRSSTPTADQIVSSVVHASSPLTPMNVQPPRSSTSTAHQIASRVVYASSPITPTNAQPPRHSASAPTEGKLGGGLARYGITEMDLNHPQEHNSSSSNPNHWLRSSSGDRLNQGGVTGKQQQSIRSTWGGMEKPEARMEIQTDTRGSFDLRNSFNSIRNSFAELSELEWLLGGGGGGRDSRTGMRKMPYEVNLHPDEAQAMLVGEIGTEGAVSQGNAVAIPRTPGPMEDEDDVVATDVGKVRPALPQKFTRDLSAPGKSSSEACSSSKFRSQDGSRSQISTRTPPVTPPFVPRREELDQHDDVNDWILLGGGLSNSSNPGPTSMPHPSDTHRDMGTHHRVRREAENSEILLHRYEVNARETKTLLHRNPTNFANARMHQADIDNELLDRPDSPSASASHEPPVHAHHTATLVTRISSFGARVPGPITPRLPHVGSSFLDKTQDFQNTGVSAGNGGGERSPLSMGSEQNGTGKSHNSNHLRSVTSGTGNVQGFVSAELERRVDLGRNMVEEQLSLATSAKNSVSSEHLHASGSHKLIYTKDVPGTDEKRASFSSSFWSPIRTVH